MTERRTCRYGRCDRPVAVGRFCSDRCYVAFEHVRIDVPVEEVA